MLSASRRTSSERCEHSDSTGSSSNNWCGRNRSPGLTALRIVLSMLSNLSWTTWERMTSRRFSFLMFTSSYSSGTVHKTRYDDLLSAFKIDVMHLLQSPQSKFRLLPLHYIQLCHMRDIGSLCARLQRKIEGYVPLPEHNCILFCRRAGSLDDLNLQLMTR